MLPHFQRLYLDLVDAVLDLLLLLMLLLYTPYPNWSVHLSSLVQLCHHLDVLQLGLFLGFMGFLAV